MSRDLITCLLRVCSALYCELSAGLSRQAVSSGVAGCSCLPDGPNPTPPPLRRRVIRLVRAASWHPTYWVVLWVASIPKKSFPITAVFRSLGCATFVPREQGSSISTYLRFDWKRRGLIIFFSLLFSTCPRFCVVSSLSHHSHDQLPLHLSGNQGSSIQDVSRRALRWANWAILRHWWPDYETTEGDISCNWCCCPDSSMLRPAMPTQWPWRMSTSVPIHL